ncbi:hypothetical protein MRX96_008147 [Rhipicephalus microplus]
MSATEKRRIASLLMAPTNIYLDMEVARAATQEMKRRCILTKTLCTAAAVSGNVVVHREKWKFHRNDRWFQDTLLNIGEQFFKQCFRVSSGTFRYIVESCRPILQHKMTAMRRDVSEKKRVAVGLYKLCSSSEDSLLLIFSALGARL